MLDELDIRGWTFELWHLDNGFLEPSATLQVSQNAPSPLQPGTILTVSEDIADDISFSPVGGDWHINFQANEAGSGAYFTAASQQNFAIDKDNTQIAIFDETGAPVSLRTGEGTVPAVSVSSEEVFLPAADINATDSVTVADAVIIAQCTVGIDRGYCPT